MSTLTQTVEYDFATGLARIFTSGELTVSAASRLRSAVLKSLADHPLAVILDVNDLFVVDELALLVLPTLARRESDAPILICAHADSQVGAMIRDNHPRFTVFEDDAAALTHLETGLPTRRRLHLHLAADPQAPGRARRLVDQACGQWGIDELQPLAELVATELVTNAVRHAGTDIDLTVALEPVFLHLHVRDRTRKLPMIAEGDPLRDQSRGLRLVDQMADGWGTTLTTYGKTVWATLRIRPFMRAPYFVSPA